MTIKEKQPEITKGYPVFDWSPVIPITEKDDETQSEEDEISSTHEDKHEDDITENGEDEESITGEKYVLRPMK